MDGLTDIRVVDLTTTIAGAYCTKVLADAGAEVVLVEPADGSPLRWRSVTGSRPEGETGALFHYLQAGKRSVRSSVPDEELAGTVWYEPSPHGFEQEIATRMQRRTRPTS